MENDYCATDKKTATPIKALVVEDTDIIQQVHCLYLEELGFEVDLAETVGWIQGAHDRAAKSQAC